MLDVTRLRVLVAVARYGSVTAAARALNYAQPSVSHHLARLEAETGTKLIQRAGRGIRLTDAGRLLAERAAEVIGRLDAAENELAAYTGLRAGRLRLAAFPSALGTIVPAAAAMLREHQPGVDLRLTEAEPPEALRMLRAGYVDVALVFRYSADPPDGLAVTGREGGNRRRRERHRPDRGPAREAPAGRAGAPGDVGFGHPGPGGAEPAAELAGYARHRWIAGCDRCRANLLRQCALAGFTPKIAFTTDDYVAVQALVAADLGVSTLPALLPAGRAAPRDQDRAAAGRPPVRVRGPLRRPARPARGEPAHRGAPRGGGAAAAGRRRLGRQLRGRRGSATVASVNPGPPPPEPAAGPGRPQGSR